MSSLNEISIDQKLGNRTVAMGEALPCLGPSQTLDFVWFSTFIFRFYQVLFVKRL
jgi:hypothetical protein